MIKKNFGELSISATDVFSEKIGIVSTFWFLSAKHEFIGELNVG